MMQIRKNHLNGIAYLHSIFPGTGIVVENARFFVNMTLHIFFLNIFLAGKQRLRAILTFDGDVRAFFLQKLIRSESRAALDYKID